MERPPQEDPRKKGLAWFAGIPVVAATIKQTFKESIATIGDDLQDRKENWIRAKIRRDQHRTLLKMAKGPIKLPSTGNHESLPKAPTNEAVPEKLDEVQDVGFVNGEIVTDKIIKTDADRMMAHIYEEILGYPPDGPSDGNMPTLG